MNTLTNKLIAKFDNINISACELENRIKEAISLEIYDYTDLRISNFDTEVDSEALYIIRNDNSDGDICIFIV
jgi:hypothetical protein